MRRSKNRLFWGVALLGLICLAGVNHMTRPADWRERTRQEIREAAKEIKEETKELSDSLKHSFKSGRNNIKEGLKELR
ncbi:YtxH domain-containing protein [Candidatus Enterococcus clewellii]|uniref:YtxH domain-containing protein n=1 Tax=Candidatus Enterococcus clewellii TaxID=1834193 RepID=A0A242KCE1_9ENTE|nr:YtxH domain-containing protein [Enterococcus sp. 9E7_DIV0242]OTP18831.1 hypothetical protein A5888_000645 [Enterococcus sp. 9E7_DIV0242]